MKVLKKPLKKGGSIFYKDAKRKFPNFAISDLQKHWFQIFKSAFYGQSLCLNINNSIVGKVCNLGGKCLKKLQ